jgi:hypothetical protein
MPSNALIAGYQGSRDGNSCGSFVQSQTLGDGGNGCLQEIGGGATYAGGAWFQNGRKRYAPNRESQKCTESQQADTLVLNDGTKYRLQGMEEGMAKELVALMFNGAVKDDVSKSFSAFGAAE